MSHRVLASTGVLATRDRGRVAGTAASDGPSPDHPGGDVDAATDTVGSTRPPGRLGLSHADATATTHRPCGPGGVDGQGSGGDRGECGPTRHRGGCAKRSANGAVAGGWGRRRVQQLLVRPRSRRRRRPAHRAQSSIPRMDASPPRSRARRGRAARETEGVTPERPVRFRVGGIGDGTVLRIAGSPSGVSWGSTPARRSCRPGTTRTSSSFRRRTTLSSSTKWCTMRASCR